MASRTPCAPTSGRTAKVSEAYGVFNEEFGRPERAIIVVDGEGICRYIDVHTLREVPDEEEIAEELKKVT